MKRRKRLSGKKSKKLFKKGARKVHTKNDMGPGLMRGGIRL